MKDGCVPDCSSHYYSWFGYCYKCPKIWPWFVVELIILIFILLVLAGMWCKMQPYHRSRAFVDILIARIKILLGYYQVAGVIFTSLNYTSWSNILPNVASVFKFLEFNIFKILTKPSCYMSQLKFDIYKEFRAVFIFIVVFVLLPAAVYACKFLYVRFRLSKYGVIGMGGIDIQAYFKKLRTDCYLLVLSMLFITYLSMTEVILSLMPGACKEFCLDETNNYRVYRLRSDYTIDCNTIEHKNYTKAAYVALLYVAGFPLFLLALLYKHLYKNSMAENEPHAGDNILNDDSSPTSNATQVDSSADDAPLIHTQRTPIGNNNDSSVGNVNMSQEGNIQVVSNDDILEDPLPNSDTEDNYEKEGNLKYPLYLRFLFEGYRPKYCYWEIIELFRKVLQTLPVVLYGTQEPLVVAATVAISAAFIVSHAYLKPMKDTTEHWLQMFSLVATFLNLLFAMSLMVPVEHTSGHRQTVVAVITIVLNVLVFFLALGKFNKYLGLIITQGDCDLLQIASLCQYLKFKSYLVLLVNPFRLQSIKS